MMSIKQLLGVKNEQMQVRLSNYDYIIFLAISTCPCRDLDKGTVTYNLLIYKAAMYLQ